MPLVGLWPMFWEDMRYIDLKILELKVTLYLLIFPMATNLMVL